MAQSQVTLADPSAERPDDCGCWNTDHELPCWPCFRDGFDAQNPAEPAADDDASVHNRINGGGA